MDCPSEERLVRMALQKPGVEALEFDLPNRRLTVMHRGSAARVLEWLEPLGFGARLAQPSSAPEAPRPASQPPSAGDERATLHVLLAINAVMFVVELAFGVIAQSTGLVADSLDMFADAAVYGVSLYAVGRSLAQQASAARLSGYLQLLLGLGALAEVVRRAALGSEPEPAWMMGVALLALVANVACLALISRHRGAGVHMKASWIFSSNDVIANAGVIVAGALVAWTASAWPDLVVGTVIALVVLSGAVRILRLARSA